MMALRGIEVIPCFYKLEYLEWPDRKEGVSAPVNTYPADSDILTKTKRDEQNLDRLPNGNYVQETASHFVVRVEDGQPTRNSTNQHESHTKKKI
jgi:hypothetical protein